MTTGSRQIAVYVPADAHAACEREARERGISMSDLLRGALVREVRGLKPSDMRPPRAGRSARVGKEARR